MKRTQKINESQPRRMRNKKRPRFHLGLFILFTFLVTVFATSGWQLYQLQYVVNGKIAQLDTEQQSLLQEKAGLEKEIIKLNTPSYVEQLAREQLGLVRKGEIMISPKKQ